MELEPSSIDFKPVQDPRPHMPDPPPVQLVAIKDLGLHCPAGLERQMDDFYIKLLHFEREESAQGQIIYKAENFRLCFEVVELPTMQEDVRATGMNVPSLSLLQAQLMEHEIESQLQRGLLPGEETIFLQDPAGNWLQIGQFGLGPLGAL